MKTPNSYEEVSKELEEVNELLLIEQEENVEIPVEDEDDRTFRMEYAFESITEGYSSFKRRNSNV